MKLRANKLGYRDGKFCIIAHPDDEGRMRDLFDSFSPTVLLEVEIKKWKPLRTNNQIRLFFSALTYLAHEMKVFDATAIKFMYEGIKIKYADRKDTGVIKDGIPIRAPIGLSECDRFEQFEVLFNGIFMEAVDEHVDMSDYLRRWEAIKREREALELKGGG